MMAMMITIMITSFIMLLCSIRSLMLTVASINNVRIVPASLIPQMTNLSRELSKGRRWYPSKSYLTSSRNRPDSLLFVNASTEREAMGNITKTLHVLFAAQDYLLKLIIPILQHEYSAGAEQQIVQMIIMMLMMLTTMLEWELFPHSRGHLSFTKREQQVRGDNEHNYCNAESPLARCKRVGTILLLQIRGPTDLLHEHVVLVVIVDETGRQICWGRFGSDEEHVI